MKEMYNSLKEAFVEDPKEFLSGLGMLSFIILFTWFMFWFFIPNFAWDM
jgi:hypothetical protein